jgi:hypothetical protein
VSISGNTDFWHNDLFTQTDQNRTGNNLFGTDRAYASAAFCFALLGAAVIVVADTTDNAASLCGLNNFNMRNGLLLA